MGVPLVLELDEDVIARLRLRAAAQGMSVEALASAAIAQASMPSREEREEWLRRVRAIRAQSKPSSVPVVDDIRAWRDGRDDEVGEPG
jgi:plasmid stability protein